ncbi:hypothetical protein [Nocardia mangyaensis]|uniref:hypothetical protein n=1 Tax=Nocardia mangyaensis TaxID=2213200 RepID=UPI002676BE72|nr:hypothetical protein [Nocardia mangyaensis]MDO3650489.1 hypothetical protein [Nocardia mangyaensis]
MQSLVLPAGVVVGLVLWPNVLIVVWRLRRGYLRKVGEAVSAKVIGCERRVLRPSSQIFVTHQVRIEVELAHPRTGVEYRMVKTFAFNEFLRSRAKGLHERFPVGATMPVLVRGRAAGFDVAERPRWIDLW